MLVSLEIVVTTVESPLTFVLRNLVSVADLTVSKLMNCPAKVGISVVCETLIVVIYLLLRVCLVFFVKKVNFSICLQQQAKRRRQIRTDPKPTKESSCAAHHIHQFSVTLTLLGKK